MQKFTVVCQARFQSVLRDEPHSLCSIPALERVTMIRQHKPVWRTTCLTTADNVLSEKLEKLHATKKRGHAEARKVTARRPPRSGLVQLVISLTNVSHRTLQSLQSIAGVRPWASGVKSP